MFIIWQLTTSTKRTSYDATSTPGGEFSAVIWSAGGGMCVAYHNSTSILHAPYLTGDAVQNFNARSFEEAREQRQYTINVQRSVTKKSCQKETRDSETKVKDSWNRIKKFHHGWIFNWSLELSGTVQHTNKHLGHVSSSSDKPKRLHNFFWANDQKFLRS